MDPVLYWNAVALESDRLAHTTIADSERGARGPIGSSRALALVHLAIHDTYFSLHPASHGTWLDGLPTPPAGASTEAALAAAACVTLSALYPNQRDRFTAAAAQADLSPQGLAEGHRYGQVVGQAVLDARRGDPPIQTVHGHVASAARFGHRPDPSNPGQGFYAPDFGSRAHCFAVTKRHELDAPPRSGAAYDGALDEVRAKGIAAHAAGTIDPAARRTPEETLAGLFWAYDGAKGIGTPPRLYNQVVRAVAVAKDNTVADNARLFALVNTALADAGVLAWTEKYRHDLWRPVLGIREHDTSIGPTSGPVVAAAAAGGPLDSRCDPFWLPEGAPRTNEPGTTNSTPNFPAYPSGHATFGAAALQVTRRYYGECADGPDRLADGLVLVSDELDGISTDNRGVVRPRHARRFPGGLWQMIEENGRSRVYLGVHWVFDAFAVDSNGQMDLDQQVGGVRLGLDVAEDITTNGLKATAAAGPAV